jgi:hypothetical protein
MSRKYMFHQVRSGYIMLVHINLGLFSLIIVRSSYVRLGQFTSV